MTGHFHISYPGPAFALWAVLGSWIAVCLLLKLGFFLFKGYPLYRIARRRGLHHAWLSWIPVGQDWIRGSISDQYQYLTRGKNNCRRVSLTVAGAACKAVEIVGLCVGIYHFAFFLADLTYPAQTSLNAFRWAVSGMTLGVVSLVAWVTRLVLHHLCMYDLYRSSDPRNDMAMTILGIVLPFLEPFFVFYVREKEEGMPPRRDRPSGNAQRPYEKPEQPVDADYRSPDYDFHGPGQL